MRHLQKSCVHTFSDKPIVGFRRLPNLSDLLTNASITYPVKDTPTKQIIPKHCTRLGRCTYCPMIQNDTSVKCNVSNRIHISSLNYQNMLVVD